MLKKEISEEDFNNYLSTNKRNSNQKFHQATAVKQRRERDLVAKNKKQTRILRKFVLPADKAIVFDSDIGEHVSMKIERIVPLSIQDIVTQASEKIDG